MPELLITRPDALARRFAAELPPHWTGRIAPLTRIIFFDPPALPSDARAILFTSQYGVAAWHAAGLPTNLPAFCVGTRTAQAASDAGFAALDAHGTLDDTVALLRETLLPAGGVILHARGRHVAGDPAGQVAGAGYQYRSFELYEAIAEPLADDIQADLARGAFSGIVFFSPRAARLFGKAAVASGWPLQAVEAFCISAKAAGPLEGLAFASCHVSLTPDEAGISAMLRCSGIT